MNAMYSREQNVHVMYVGGCFYLICGGLAGEMVTGQRETLYQWEGKNSKQHFPCWNVSAFSGRKQCLFFWTEVKFVTHFCIVGHKKKHPINKRSPDHNAVSLKSKCSAQVFPWSLMHNRLLREGSWCADVAWRSEDYCRCFWQRWHPNGTRQSL